MNLRRTTRDLGERITGRRLFKQKPTFGPETVVDMVFALEAKDDFTARHSGRVAEISRLVAERMGLHAGRLSEVRLAGLLHDIGKMRVLDDLLGHDVGILSPEAVAMVEAHAEAGGKILDSVMGSTLFAQVARQHHERMDGSGYPAALEADEISLEAKIVAVVEAAEEMSMSLPYGRGLELQRVRKELEEGKGTRYDERVVDAFLSLLERGLELGLLDTPLPRDVLMAWWTGEEGQKGT